MTTAKKSKDQLKVDDLVGILPYLTDAEIEKVTDALRTQLLIRDSRNPRAVGAQVRVEGMPSRHLNGLEGRLARCIAGRADVELAAEYAAELHRKTRGRYGSLSGGYTLRGVPASCLRPVPTESGPR